MNPLIQKTPTGLLPYGPHSGPEFEEAVNGQVWECKPRKGRTLPRNAAYWAGLGKAIKATEAWPTAQHLHNDLKMLCGYTETYINPLTGHLSARVQSTAFDKMDEGAFAVYFRQAQRLFIDKMGFDPWTL